MGKSELSKKIQAVGPSATLAVSNRARELREMGESVISFGAGEPNFPTPEHIVRAAEEACHDPRWHKYSPAAGLPELRQAVAEKTMRDSAWEVAPEQVVITCGGKHAIYNSFQILLNPGDEVIILAPYWTTYPESVSLAGGVPVALETEAANGFMPTVEQLDSVRTERTKALVFVSPSNPTGVVCPKSEMEAIGKWAVENKVWVVTDEIYEHLTYDGTEHYSMPALVPEVGERCIVVNGVAKTYAMTGWRIGWLISTPEVAKACNILQSHQTTNMPNVTQIAALAAISGSLEAVEEMKEAFNRRRLKMYEMLRDIDGVDCDLPQGAFYAFPSFKERLKSPVRTASSDTQSGAGGEKTLESTQELAKIILEETKVALVPGEAFGAPGYCRLSFALSDEGLEEGLTRLTNFLNS